MQSAFSLAERSAHMCHACLVELAFATCLQGRPALVFGDAVYLRLAGRPQEEAAASLMSQRGTQALLALPPGFMQALKKVGARDHVLPYPPGSMQALQKVGARCTSRHPAQGRSSSAHAAP